MLTFFDNKPTYAGLKKLEGLYSITIPKSYPYIAELSTLIFKNKHNVIIRFKKERIHMDVIKLER